jgi:hypothetical protein
MIGYRALDFGKRPGTAVRDRFENRSKHLFLRRYRRPGNSSRTPAFS